MADAAAWDDVIDELAALLPRLRDGDAVTLLVGRRHVLFKQFGRDLSVIASGADPTLPEQVGVSAEQSRQMLALGWELSDDMPAHVLPDLTRPVSVDTAERVSRLLVATVRDVYGAASPAEAVFESHNDGGERTPTLRTVAMSADQEPEVRPDPAALLPAPAPDWRAHLEALLAGLDTWSRAEVEAVLRHRGWEPDGEDRWAVPGALRASVQRTTGYAPDRHIDSVTLHEPMPVAEAGARFREVLAAAVAVLGNPPMVGGPDAFARWRGKALTVVVSRVLRRDTARIALVVTPTDVIERAENLSAEYSDGSWSLDQRWATEPDTDAPENEAVGRAMMWPHPRPANLREFGDDLRDLCRSLAADLPLLHPYASSACLRIAKSSGEHLVEVEFTHERARLRVGNAPSETVALEGEATGTLLAERVMDALTAAGVESPGRLRVRTWSATPAERLHADEWFVPA